MIENNPPTIRSGSTTPPQAHLSPVVSIKSTGSITLAMTPGESSPTSILADITADYPNGVSELKHLHGYSDQLFLPEAMIYGNDLIKVWSIDDEQSSSSSNDDSHQIAMVQLHEKPAYNEKLCIAFSGKESPNEDESTQTALVSRLEEMDILDEGMDVGEDMGMDMDDLFLTLPPSSISLPPRMSIVSVMSPPVSPPASPPASPCIGRDSLHCGSSNTVVLEKTSSNFDINNISLDELLLQPTTTSTTKPPRGHRKRHRRNQSHFDFKFTN